MVLSLCGCITRSNCDSSPPPQPRLRNITNNHYTNNSANQPNTPTDHPSHHHQDPQTYYTSPDLPRYTPRPHSLHEKTLHAHLRDPPISSSTSSFSQRPSLDEKSRFDTDLTSDVSSAISFTSSYGNTSTATRDTPPPPYSPRGCSPAPSRRSVSTVGSGVGMGMVQIAQPRAVVLRSRGLVGGLLGRRSLEGEEEER